MPNLADLLDFLAFWGPIEDVAKYGDEKKQWKADLRRQMGTRDDATLDALAARMQSRYDDIEATRSSIASRASSLLLFVGVLTTGAGLIAQSLVGEPWPVVIAFVVVGGLLLYSTVAAAVLAVRAQLVTNWDLPWVDPEDAADVRSVKVVYVTEITVAVVQNKVRVRTPVALLRDGQRYALAAIVLLAMLAALSVPAAVLKTQAVPSSAPPVPAATAAGRGPRQIAMASPNRHRLLEAGRSG